MHWKKIEPGETDTPIPRYGHSAAVIDTRSEWGTELLLVYGGISRRENLDIQAYLNDLKVFQVEQESWVTPGDSPGPGQRAFHAASVYEKNMYIFGGHCEIHDNSKSMIIKRYFNDIWCLNASNWQWIEIDIPFKSRPIERDLSSIVSINEHRILLFGGRCQNGKALSDLWMLDLETKSWSSIVTTGPVPSPRFKHAFIMHKDQLVLYGGETLTGSFFDDLWVLQLPESNSTHSWKWHFIKCKPRPAGRSGHAMTSCGNLIVCFGGHIAPSNFMFFSQNHQHSKEVWLLNGLKRWYRLEATEINTPAERVCASIVNVASNKLLMYGGRGRDILYSDIWWLDLETSEHQLMSPNSRSISSLASYVLPTSLSSYQWSTSNIFSTKTMLNQMSNNFLTASMSSSSNTVNAYPANSVGMSNGNNYQDPVVAINENPVQNQDNDELESGVNNKEQILKIMYEKYAIDISQSNMTILDMIPESEFIDGALINIGHRMTKSNAATVLTGRKALANCPPSEIKMGYMWLILADYKRMASEVDILKMWREAKKKDATVEFTFLNTTPDNVKILDLPQLLSEYKELVELRGA